MPRRSLIPALLVVSAIALAGCASTPAPAATGSASTPAPSASPTATPTVDAHIVVAIDGLSLVDDEGTTTADFADAASVLALLEKATGVTPEPTAVENPPGYEMQLVNFDWDGLTLVTDEGGAGLSRIIVKAPTVNGVPIASGNGFSVGSTREALGGAGAKEVFDADGDGVADEVSLGDREVPGTDSLRNPGQVGVEYLMFSITDDVVTRIFAPADDFSDL